MAGGCYCRNRGPAAPLNQLGALLDGLADLGSGDSAIDRVTVTQQVDDLIRDVKSAAEGTVEVDLVTSLLRWRDDITGRKALGSEFERTARDMQEKIDGFINHYFETNPKAIPVTAEYLERLD